MVNTQNLDWKQYGQYCKCLTTFYWIKGVLVQLFTGMLLPF